MVETTTLDVAQKEGVGDSVGAEPTKPEARGELTPRSGVQVPSFSVGSK